MQGQVAAGADGSKTGPRKASFYARTEHQQESDRRDANSSLTTRHPKTTAFDIHIGAAIMADGYGRLSSIGQTTSGCLTGVIDIHQPKLRCRRTDPSQRISRLTPAARLDGILLLLAARTAAAFGVAVDDPDVAEDDRVAVVL